MCLAQAGYSHVSTSRPFKSTSAAVIASVRSLPRLHPSVTVTFNPSGYATSFLQKARRRQPQSEMERIGLNSDDSPLDLSDSAFRDGERAGEKWGRLRHADALEQRCSLCTEAIDTTVSPAEHSTSTRDAYS